MTSCRSVMVKITCTSHPETYTLCERGCDAHMTSDTLFVLRHFRDLWGWRWMGRETAAISIHLQFLVVTHQADSWLPPYLTSRQCALALISQSDNVHLYTPKIQGQIIKKLYSTHTALQECLFKHILHTLARLKVHSLWCCRPHACGIMLEVHLSIWYKRTTAFNNGLDMLHCNKAGTNTQRCLCTKSRLIH